MHTAYYISIKQSGGENNPLVTETSRLKDSWSVNLPILFSAYPFIFLGLPSSLASLAILSIRRLLCLRYRVQVDFQNSSSVVSLAEVSPSSVFEGDAKCP